MLVGSRYSDKTFNIFICLIALTFHNRVREISLLFKIHWQKEVDNGSLKVFCDTLGGS